MEEFLEAQLSIISKVGATISITDNNTNSPITGLTGGATSTLGTVTGNTNYVYSFQLRRRCFCI